jgi:hypothetical protein
MVEVFVDAVHPEIVLESARPLLEPLEVVDLLVQVAAFGAAARPCRGGNEQGRAAGSGEEQRDESRTHRKLPPKGALFLSARGAAG